MDSGREKELQIIAARVRKNAVTGVYHAKSGHPGRLAFRRGHFDVLIL